MAGLGPAPLIGDPPYSNRGARFVESTKRFVSLMGSNHLGVGFGV